MGFEIGTHLGPYIVEEFLDAGGMGEVYRARDPRLGRDVAIKVLPRGLSDQPEFRERFTRETRAMSSLNHKNICTVYDTGTFEERPYIVMELMKGRTLAAALDGSPMRTEKVLKIGIEIASALEAMHGAGIIHRDIKTANVFLTPRGDAKVLDFGIAKIALGDDTDPGRRARLTGQQNPMGTVAYMSPEQASGAEVDTRSDLYSLGVVLFEMATGEPPFRGSPTAILARLGSPDPVPAPTTVNRMLPIGLDRVIRRALEKDPQVRYQTAADLLADLRRVQRDLSLGISASPARAAVASGAWRGRGLRIATVAGGVLVVGWMAFTFLPMSADRVGSIAVVPCLDEEGSAEGIQTCGVLAQRLVTALSMVSPDLDVKSYALVDDFTRSGMDPFTVGEQLGVDAIIDLRLEEGDGDPTIQAEVVDVRTAGYVWDFDIPGTGSIDQGQVLQIASTVSERLRPSSRLADPDRWALLRRYQDAEYQWQQRTSESLTQARALLEGVIRDEPEFAPAHASLAITNILLHYYGSATAEEAYPAAKEAADRAIALNDTLSAAYAARGLYHRDFERAFYTADLELQRAIQLDSESALALQWYAEQLAITRQFEAAEEYILRAERAGPLDIAVAAVHGWIHLGAGETAEARRLLERVLAREPGSMPAIWFMGQLEFVEGDYEQSALTLGEVARLTDNASRMVADHAAALAMAGRPDQARALVAEIELSGGSTYEAAILKAALGAPGEALVDLREAARSERTWQIASMGIDPMLTTLYGEPEFEDLLVNVVGLPPLPEAR
jgi:tetratricopeptide (TPR) repeat protein